MSLFWAAQRGSARREARLRQEASPSEADILLEAIVVVARKEQTMATRGALRELCARFYREHGLDF